MNAWNSSGISGNNSLGERDITDGYSLEMTSKDIAALQNAANLIPQNTSLSVTFLPSEDPKLRIAAAILVRQLGFDPMPHFSARRILSQVEFEDYLHAVVKQASVSRCFIVAGDPAQPMGPYADTTSLIETGAFERAGIRTIGIAGHPEGHPVMSVDQRWAALESKVNEIERRGMDALIVTQFGFDSDKVLLWLGELRSRGIVAPVRIGIPGPASIASLLRFAARCGVGASTAVMKKYGVSITSLLGSAGPDKLVHDFASQLGPNHGAVRLHFYPFGGLLNTVQWIDTYRRTSCG